MVQQTPTPGLMVCCPAGSTVASGSLAGDWWTVERPENSEKAGSLATNLGSGLVDAITAATDNLRYPFDLPQIIPGGAVLQTARPYQLSDIVRLLEWCDICGPDSATDLTTGVILGVGTNLKLMLAGGRTAPVPHVDSGST